MAPREANSLASYSPMPLDAPVMKTFIGMRKVYVGALPALLR